MGWLVNTTPRPLYPRERPGTHCIEGWVGPRVGLDGCEKSPPPQPVFDPRTFQPVGSRYPDLGLTYREIKKYFRIFSVSVAVWTKHLLKTWLQFYRYTDLEYSSYLAVQCSPWCNGICCPWWLTFPHNDMKASMGRNGEPRAAYDGVVTVKVGRVFPHHT